MGQSVCECWFKRARRAICAVFPRRSREPTAYVGSYVGRLRACQSCQLRKTVGAVGGQAVFAFYFFLLSAKFSQTSCAWRLVSRSEQGKRNTFRFHRACFLLFLSPFLVVFLHLSLCVFVSRVSL